VSLSEPEATAPLTTETQERHLRAVGYPGSHKHLGVSQPLSASLQRRLTATLNELHRQRACPSHEVAWSPDVSAEQIALWRLEHYPEREDTTDKAARCLIWLLRFAPTETQRAANHSPGGDR